MCFCASGSWSASILLWSDIIYQNFWITLKQMCLTNFSNNVPENNRFSDSFLDFLVMKENIFLVYAGVLAFEKVWILKKSYNQSSRYLSTLLPSISLRIRLNWFDFRKSSNSKDSSAATKIRSHKLRPLYRSTLFQKSRATGKVQQDKQLV